MQLLRTEALLINEWCRKCLWSLFLLFDNTENKMYALKNNNDNN